MRLVLSVEQRGGSWEVQLLGASVRYEHRCGQAVLERRQAEPSHRDWQRFWSSIERIGVWRWADGYEGERGEQRWRLELGHEERQLRSGGSAFPPLADALPTPEFLRLCGALATLVGDVPLPPS